MTYNKVITVIYESFNNATKNTSQKKNIIFPFSSFPFYFPYLTSVCYIKKSSSALLLPLEHFNLKSR